MATTSIPIEFEHILPWGTTGGDTGLSARLKLKRNFEKIKAWMDSIDLSGDLDEKYLSKVADDVAKGVISFLSGLYVGGDKKYGIGADGTATLLGMIFSGLVKSEGAISGFEGGRGILMDAVKGLIEADGLEVRGFMRVMELIINRLQLMESDYSFTEGGQIETVTDNEDGTLTLLMHKDHDNDLTPFAEGDILYAKINDLLAHGTYYTSWMRVTEKDTEANTLRVAVYPDNEVPGGRNFAPTAMANVTRHGNVTNEERQQSWVLSTTDKRLTFFWRVDKPIIEDSNYALCLGLLPDLQNLPSTRNKEMPSLYVNTIFYDHQHRANWPARVVKEDRGQWSMEPEAAYEGGYSGTYTPDGTLPEGSMYGKAVTVSQGDSISEPYHSKSIPVATWLRYRLSGLYDNMTDAELLQKMQDEWHEEVDLETSRAWKGGKLWECRKDGTTEEPRLGCEDWRVVSGDTSWTGQVVASNGAHFRNGNVDTVLTMRVWWGTEDVTDIVKLDKGYQIRWERLTGYDSETRQYQQQAEDLAWAPVMLGDNMLLLTRNDMGSGWMTDYRSALIRCTVTAEGIDGVVGNFYL